MAYVYHIDPGHGWLQVPRSELSELGILQNISGYSYQKRNEFWEEIPMDDVYLEEDCDFPRFTKAYLEKYGKSPEIVEKNYRREAEIRGMERFDGAI